MTFNDSLPPYVYRDKITENSLLQGDILKVGGEFKAYFKEFYPAINHHDEEDKYVMILTQSCDLVKEKKRKPKLTHVNVCLIKSLKSFIQKLITEELKPLSIDGKRFLERDALDKLKEKISKLLNNADQKTHFFLPAKLPFTEDMITLLPLSFSFRIAHYDLFLQNRALGLKSEFQAKIGYTISQLYGRIATTDLSECEWGDKQTRNYIKNLLGDLDLIQVPDSSFIEYIKANYNHENSIIENLIKDCQTKQTDDAFKPIKNELLQNISRQLLTIFENKNEIEQLIGMKKIELSKRIKEIFKQL